MIKVTNLKRSFENIKAVDGVSFTIDRGEIVGFLGPNGAGKTTTMRLMAGYLSADEGKVEIDGVNVESADRQIIKTVGYLPENNPLYREMLVQEFLETSARLKGMSRPAYQQGLEFVVKSMDIADVYYRPIRELSKGFRQRVGMAAALINDPKVVIMDEPTEGLDPNQRTEMRSLIKKMARDRTFLVSTHVMGEAQAIANRLLIIHQGKIVADGAVEELSKSKSKKIEIDIEGQGVVAMIKNIKTIKISNRHEIKRGRMRLLLEVQGKDPVQPEIAKLAARHKWVIWSLNEEKKDLEKVFAELTK